MNVIYVLFAFLNLFFFGRNIEVFELIIICSGVNNFFVLFFKLFNHDSKKKSSSVAAGLASVRDGLGGFRLNESKFTDKTK